MGISVGTNFLGDYFVVLSSQAPLDLHFGFSILKLLHAYKTFLPSINLEKISKDSYILFRVSFLHAQFEGMLEEHGVIFLALRTERDNLTIKPTTSMS